MTNVTAYVTAPISTEVARGELADPKGGCFRMKATGVEEIRFSWWPKGMANKPLDLPEQELLELLREAIGQGVFCRQFLRTLHTALYDLK